MPAGDPQAIEEFRSEVDRLISRGQELRLESMEFRVKCAALRKTSERIRWDSRETRLQSLLLRRALSA
jgi:hypothetical protein